MKILVLTSIYPYEEKKEGYTPVVHYITKEWVKMGHDVRVVHNKTGFPKILFKIPKPVITKFENKLGFIFPTREMMTESKFVLDGVKVSRFLIRKVIPFIPYSYSSLNILFERIKNLNSSENFVPDVIACHFSDPQIPLGIMLKDFYKVGLSMVLHDIGKNLLRYSNEEIKRFDSIGFRSIPIKNAFYENYSFSNRTFMCYSGISENSIGSPKKFQDYLKKFLFAGVLTKRKNVDSIIGLINNIKSEVQNVHLKVLGDGPEMNDLQLLKKKYNLSKEVTFEGYVSRDQVLEEMSLSECFIMISNDEVFGLVYIEALAKGCIVIAGRGEGMEGIIIDGYNGYLCKPGDTAELISIINKINELSRIEKEAISRKAIETAKNLTEFKVAETYLQNLRNNRHE